jgi:hypothetical protein
MSDYPDQDSGRSQAFRAPPFAMGSASSIAFRAVRARNFPWRRGERLTGIAQSPHA